MPRHRLCLSRIPDKPVKGLFSGNRNVHDPGMKRRRRPSLHQHVGTVLGPTHLLLFHHPRVAVGADPSKQSVGFHLLGHDGTLQSFHDRLAVVDRQPDVIVA